MHKIIVFLLVLMVGGAMAGVVQAGEATAPLPQKAVKKSAPPDPDRRWIMRQQDYTLKKIAPRPVTPIKWANKDQENRCRAREKELVEAYDKARDFSIQGDRCKTARYAEIFLKHADACRKDCPATFLERQGYSDLIVRNMRQLQALGRESCYKTPRRPALAGPPAKMPNGTSTPEHP